MTNEEFIAKLTQKCDCHNFAEYVAWNWSHPQWRELSDEPQFKAWFSKLFNENGHSQTDEHYAYLGETDIDKELGSRLSWFSSWSCFGELEHIELEDDFFPLYADAFSYDNKKYWVLTMVGQGAISWLMTDEAFRIEYFKGEQQMKLWADDARPAPEYVTCKECAMWEDCENKESRDGCYFGENEGDTNETLD